MPNQANKQQDNQPTRPARKPARSINGMLLLDKPLGLSSNAALQRVKRLLGAKKAGHTGSLDPLASGMLPICLGEATKLSSYLLNADKYYEVTAKLGETTDTADAEGAVIKTRPVPTLDQDQVELVLAKFRGEISQIPPMYSAIKVNGQPLYKLARQGVVIERAPRELTIFSLTFVELTSDTLTLRVHCSKGTYIRTLIEDIGEQLDCGAHVIMLRRTAVADYESSEMVTMEVIEKYENSDDIALSDLIKPVDFALSHFPKVSLTSELAFFLRRGQPVAVFNLPDTDSGFIRLYGPEADFFGLGRIDSEGRLALKRLVFS